MKNNKEITLGVVYRTAEVTRMDDSETENPIIELSFSSETAVERSFGFEILDHNPKSVKLDRLNNKAPFLLDHDPAQQIGVVERAEVSADKKGRAVVKFSRSEKAMEIWQDIKDGIRSLVSVGYRINEMKLEKKTNDGDVFRITNWEPMEISLVSIPADTAVGIGRAETDDKKPVTITNVELEKMAEVTVTETRETVDVEKIKQQTRAAELSRISEISAIAEKFNMREEAQKAINGNTTVDDFRQAVLNKLDSQKAIDTKASEIDFTEKEKREYSLTRAIQAAISKDWRKAGFEAEISAELARKLKMEPQGFFVPQNIVAQRASMQMKRDLLTTGSTANLVPTDHLGSEFIDLLRNQAVVASLGARILTGLSGNVDIPKQTAGQSGSWLAEGGAPTAADQTFGTLALSPKTVAADTNIGMQAIIQSNPSIEALVMSDLMAAINLAVDLAAIDGSGASNQPTGILNTSSIGSVDMSGGITWAKCVELETDVAAANADLASMAYLTNATIVGSLKTIKKDAGSGIFLLENGQLNGYNVARSNQVPAATMIFGAFSQLILAFWGAFDLMVDPYTLSANRKVALRATQLCDIGVRYAGAFSATEDIA